MSPLGWLRATMKRKPKMAAGGWVAAPKPGDLLALQRGCAWPIDTTRRPSLPDGATIQFRGYTEMTAEELRRFLDDVQAHLARPSSAPASRVQPPDGNTGSRDPQA